MSSTSGNGKDSKSSNLFGMKVDWEMKLLGIASIFATVKFFQGLVGSSLYTIIARAIFIAGHLFFVFIYSNTTGKVAKSTSRSDAEKTKIKAACLAIFKGIMVRAVAILLVHWRTILLPPLIVSVLLGFCSLIENDYFYQVMYTFTPRIFEIMYA